MNRCHRCGSFCGSEPMAPTSRADRWIKFEEHFGVLGERRRGLGVLEFWEILVRDLYGRSGNRGIA